MQRLNIPPTKSVLLTLRRQITFLERGHELLERKRELLTRLVSSRLAQYRKLRSEVRHALAESYHWLAISEMRMGGEMLRQAAVDTFHETMWLYWDLWHGKCRQAGLADAAKTAEFIITGHYDEWVKVAKKELDPIQGMMVGKLKLEGDMTKIMRATKAAVELVNTITMMDGVEF